MVYENGLIDLLSESSQNYGSRVSELEILHDLCFFVRLSEKAASFIGKHLKMKNILN